MTPLRVKRAVELAIQPEAEQWLVEQLWLEGAVGIIGGEPKCCKSFLGLQLAVAVATGEPLLGRFPVPRPGPVLLYAAEDAEHMVRSRLEKLCAHAGVDFRRLEVYVIAVPALRLDHDSDRTYLFETVADFKPRLLLLDPFVRLHRIDENASREVAPILAYLRELQRGFALSVMVVHHAKKNGGNARAGQALRGSSEFHAWGDSNLYLRRKNNALILSVEHRAAAAIDALALKLSIEPLKIGLEILEQPKESGHAPLSIEQRIRAALTESCAPLSSRELRQRLRVNMTTLNRTLQDLAASGAIATTQKGYQLAVTVTRSS